MCQCIAVEDRGNVAIVTFTNRKVLDELWIQHMGAELFRLVDELKKTRLILNFGELDYFSSAAMGKLITLNKKATAAGGKMVICEVPNTDSGGVDRKIYEVFEITRLNRLFRMFVQDPANIGKTLEEALALFTP